MYPNNSESFRNELITKLSNYLSPDQLQSVLADFDVTSVGYDIIRKPMDLITMSGLPEAVQWFLDAKALSNLSHGTIKQYAYRLTDFFRSVNKPFNDISATDIRCYMNRFKKERNASGGYLDDIRKILNSFFTWMVKNDHLIRNPCAKLDAVKYEPTVREPFTPLELEEVRWNCKDVRERSIIDFLFSTGLRISECSNVKLSDINWNERSVTIPHGKGDKFRIVFFNAESEFTLRKYLSTRNDNIDCLFITSKGEKKKLEVRSLQNVIRKIGKRCELHTYPHRFRHTFATHGIQSGMPLHILQALMGHANPRTTLGYAKNDTTDLRMSHRKSFS